MFEDPLKRVENSRFEDALKRARRLYYQNLIGVQSKGKRGKITEFKELSDGDKAALVVLRDSQLNIPPSIRNFILEVTKEDS